MDAYSISAYVSNLLFTKVSMQLSISHSLCSAVHNYDSLCRCSSRSPIMLSILLVILTIMYVCMYVCICMYVCMCMYVCLFVWLCRVTCSLWMDERMDGWMDGRMYVCLSVWLSVSMSVFQSVCYNSGGRYGYSTSGTRYL